MGPDLLTDIRYALYTEQRKVAVAYHLLLDKKRREEQDTNPIALEEERKIREKVIGSPTIETSNYCSS